jgi:hypothetical protein
MLDKLKGLRQDKLQKRASITQTFSRRNNLTKHQYKNHRSTTLHPLTYRRQGQDPAIGRPVEDEFVERSVRKVGQPRSLLVAELCAHSLKPYPS